MDHHQAWSVPLRWEKHELWETCLLCSFRRAQMVLWVSPQTCLKLSWEGTHWVLPSWWPLMASWLLAEKQWKLWKRLVQYILCKVHWVIVWKLWKRERGEREREREREREKEGKGGEGEWQWVRCGEVIYWMREIELAGKMLHGILSPNHAENFTLNLHSVKVHFVNLIMSQNVNKIPTYQWSCIVIMTQKLFLCS